MHWSLSESAFYLITYKVSLGQFLDFSKPVPPLEGDSDNSM